MTVSATRVRLIKRDTRSTAFAEGGANAVQIKKLDQDEQIVFAEVYAPNFPDSQGDFMSAEEIKKTAYDFMKKSALSNIDTNHSRDPNGSYVVESFIARKDDPVFIPGSWVIGVKVPDQQVWSMVKSGELNGFSLDGFGVRTEKPFEVEMPDALTGQTSHDASHEHGFAVKFDGDGNFLGGSTNPGRDGHVHTIARGTVTEPAGWPSHSHRFSFVEGVLNAQAVA